MLDKLNPRSKLICPYCNFQFDAGDCAIVSQATPGLLMKTPPVRGIQRLQARLTPEPLAGVTYVRELASRQCPHCGRLLPYNIEQVDSVTIAIVGDTFSGKSHYLAALLRHIQAGEMQYGGQIHSAVCLTEATLKKYRREYLDPLFRDKHVLPATHMSRDATHDPLIYELVSTRSRNYPPRRFNLVFYDLSGEDCASTERLVQYLPHILRASTFIYLVDPVSALEKYERFSTHLQDQPTTGRGAAQVLASILSTLSSFHGVKPGSLLNGMPFAITLSKSDLLKSSTDSSKQYKFLSHPEPWYRKGINLRDLEEIDRDVRQLIGDFGDRSLLETAKRLNSVQFFAISATGHAAIEFGQYPEVQPLRCLDPLLWILSKLGFIEAYYD